MKEILKKLETISIQLGVFIGMFFAGIIIFSLKLAELNDHMNRLIEVLNK